MFSRRAGGRNAVKRIVRSIAEKKAWDIAFLLSSSTTPTPDPVTFAGQIRGLTGITQGYADNQRIGDKVTGTSLRLVVECSPVRQQVLDTSDPAVTPAPFMELRLIVFVWKDDADPTMAEILSLPATPNSDQWMCPLNHDRKVKRKILVDEILRATASFTGPVLSTTNVVAHGWNSPLVFNRTINLTKLKGGLNTINFVGGGLDGVNEIYILLVNNIPAVGGAGGFDYTWNTRVNSRYIYTDM